MLLVCLKIQKKIFLLFCLVVISNVIVAQKPNANFSTNVVKGCAPLIVQFNDLSTNIPVNWSWNLGNGVTSTLQNPVTTYFTPGVYTIQLIATNASGSDTVIKTSYIKVHDIPTVNFNANKTSGCFPLHVQFSDLSSANSGTIATWNWDFGDGTTSTSPNPAHTYVVVGNFPVNLKITNSEGCTKTLNKPNFISVPGGVLSDFNIGSISSCLLPVNVAFNGTSTGTGILSYEWDFGDGTTSTLQNPTHTYNTNGTYTVKLITSNNQGCKDTLIKTNGVVIGTVDADFTSSGFCLGKSTQFQNTSTPATGTYFWYFGDGTTSTLQNPVKTFSAINSYSVKLVVDFGACKDSVTKLVDIFPSPSSVFSNTPTGACLAPLAVNFAPGITNYAAYLWDFGDGNTSTLPNPSHSYQTQGNFHVKLITTNAHGCKDTIVNTNAVIIAPPDIKLFTEGAPYSGCAPYTSSFKVLVETQDSVANYEWDFGDGTPKEIGINPTHTYNNVGLYTITVVVTTLNGCKDTLVAFQTVKLFDKPTANFSATPLVGCAKDNIAFTNLSSNNVNTWSWSFGDGGTSTLPNPIYNYSDTGFFSVRLIVSNSNCKDTLQLNNYIYINPPVALFYTVFNCDTPLTRTFIDQSIGAVTYLWEFGDGNTSTAPNPTHTYATNGVYNVKLTVTNGGCTHTASANTIIAFVNPVITVTDTAFCKYSDVVYSINNIIPSVVNSYIWDFGDGTILSGNNLSTVTHQYTTSGNVTPTVIINDIVGCSDTLTLQPPIKIFGPVANFTNPAGTCINGVIGFSNTSTTDGIHNITQLIWNYGDGAIDTLTAPPYNHQYNSEGFFNVKLKVFDDFGCYDTLIKPNAVQITKPIAGFYTNDTLKCANSNIPFQDTSKGVSLTHLWSFSDGTTSTQQNAIKSFALQGQYSVSLKVTDIFGCIDTLVKPLYIRVANSVADFNFLQGDTLGLCYPFLIEVANLSANTSNVNWSFGDNGFSNLDTPSHIYATAGKYILKLKAFGFGNCVDSTQKEIVVRGPVGTFDYSPLQFCSPTTVNFVAHTKNNATFVWDFADGVIVLTADSVISHVYNSPGIFRPGIIMIDSAGCQVPILGADTVRVADVSTLIKVPQTQFCDSVQLSFLDSTVVLNDTLATYLWNFGDGITSNLQNPIHFYNQTGSYTITLKVTTNLGCTDTDTLNAPIHVVKTPQIAIGGDSVSCINSLLQFNGDIILSDTNTLSWQWNLANGNTSNLKNPVAQQYSTAGNYIVKAIAYNVAGCADTVSKNIVIHGLPNISAGIDTFVCKGKTIKLAATGGSSYVWDTNPTLSCINCASPIVNTINTATYKVTGTSNVGCKNTDSVLVTVIEPFVLSVSLNDSICIGNSTPLQAIASVDKFQWQPTTGLNNANIPNPIATPNVTTAYMVIAKDNKNCFADTGIVEIAVFPIPQFNIVESFIQSNVGNTVPLVTTNSSDINKWNWIPSQWLSCNDCPSPNASITDKIKYVAEVSNAGGCTARDEVTIEPLCNDYNVFIPNTFSPNNDGVNDVFYPRGKGLFTVRNITIFNRWGEIVFNKRNINANNATDGWDGSFNGKQLSADVYVYTIEVVCANSKVLNLKGNITLLR